jgi:hypothetical protein
MFDLIPRRPTLRLDHVNANPLKYRDLACAAPLLRRCGGKGRGDLIHLPYGGLEKPQKRKKLLPDTRLNRYFDNNTWRS